MPVSGRIAPTLGLTQPFAAAYSFATKPRFARPDAMSELRVLSDAFIPELPNRYNGKVRENYDLPGGERIIIATDRLSAFDIILTSIPHKGHVLTQTARYWFEETADICPNHVIELSRPECRHRQAARHPAGRNRRARLSRRHHQHVDPDEISQRRARHVWHSICPTACATIRSFRKQSSRRPARPSTAAMMSRCRKTKFSSKAC